jgi:hypothetical protein
MHCKGENGLEGLSECSNKARNPNPVAVMRELFSVSGSTFPYNNHLNTSVSVVRRRSKKFLPLPEFKILETTLTNKTEVHENVRRIDPGYICYCSGRNCYHSIYFPNSLSVVLCGY